MKKNSKNNGMKIYRMYLPDFTYFYVITNNEDKLFKIVCNCVCASKIVNYNEFQNDIAWLECHKNEKIF